LRLLKPFIQEAYEALGVGFEGLEKHGTEKRLAFARENDDLR